MGSERERQQKVPEAIRKAVEQAKKSLLKFPLKNATIPHRIIGKFGAGTVVINPAVKGTGIIAGGAVRALLEVGGVQNVVAKSIRSHNPFNSVKATLNGLASLKEPDSVMKLRGKVEEESQEVS